MEPPKATVIVPLYIWPTSSSLWEPLFQAISKHAAVNFLVIVNPNSGPGLDPFPGHDYEREVPKLNSAPNVCTIGYVKIDYCQRPLHETCEDIDRFAGWATKDDGKSGLAMHGIYLDETPNHYSAERAAYLDALYKHIKSCDGLLGPRLVVHNPGTPPDSGLAGADMADVIITCEEPYERYASDQVRDRLREYFVDRTRAGHQISNVPLDRIYDVTKQLRHEVGFVFATSLSQDFYESFGECWQQFVAAMDDLTAR